MNTVINGAIGGWYPKGQERLSQSLFEHSPDVRQVLQRRFGFKGLSNNPYNIKADMMRQMKRGHRTLWMDCSCWAIKDIKPIFDIIKRDGYYLLSSGYNAAQTCNDKCLDYFDITRDDAEKIPDSSTMVFGYDLLNPIGCKFAELFITASFDEIADGSRFHDNQSVDPRFLFHRQDQSIATCIAYKLGMKLHSFGEHVHYDKHGKANDSVCVISRGM